MVILKIKENIRKIIDCDNVYCQKKNLEGKYQIKKTLIIVIEKIRNLLLRENAK